MQRFVNVVAWTFRVFVVFFIAGTITCFLARSVAELPVERKCAVGSYTQHMQDESGSFIVYHCVVIIKSSGEQRYINAKSDGGTIQM